MYILQDMDVFSFSIRHCLVFGAVAVGKIGAQEDAGDASQIEYGPDIFGKVYRDERIVQDSDAPGDEGDDACVFVGWFLAAPVCRRTGR